MALGRMVDFQWSSQYERRIDETVCPVTTKKHDGGKRI